MNYALSVYPLSSHVRARLQKELAADPVGISLAELRRQPLAAAIGRLRGLAGGRLVIQLEDQNSWSILPMLQAVAAVSNAGSIEVRDQHSQVQPIAKWRLRLSLLSLLRATGTAARDALICNHELSSLLKVDRTAATEDTTAAAMYLNANLWFGLKAGGSVGHVAGVVNALKDRGYDLLYASPGGRPMIRDEVDSCQLAPPSVYGLPYELNYYAFHRSVVRQLTKLRRPRFVYQRMSIANYAGVTLSRRWKVPLVLEYNGSEVWVTNNWGLRLKYPVLAQKAEKASLRHAHLVVTISAVLRDELIEKGVSPDNIVCYPNCIDPVVFDPSRFSQADRDALRGRVGIRKDAVVVTFVGTFGRWHGAEVLAAAIRKLVTEHRQWLVETGVQFLLVGDGVGMPEVREIVDTEDCRPFVTLTGLVPQEEAASYLAASDVLVSPHVRNADGTRFFGSPTKLFEYMAMAKAIIASDLDQIGEVLARGLRAENLPADEPARNADEVAILFQPGDIEGLVRSIKFVTTRRQWRRVLGGNARAEALGKYTWRRHVEAIVGRLGDLMKQAKYTGGEAMA